MNEELKAKLLQYLGVMEEASRKGADLAADKIPETIQQWVTFSIVEGIAIGLCLVCLYAGSLVAAAKLVRHGIKIEGHGDPFGYYFGGWALGILCNFLIIPILLMAHQTLMAWLAPNVFIIKEIATLLK